MKKRICLKSFIGFCMIAIICIGCSSGSGDGNGGYEVSGYIQKGPFISGSSILVQELDDNLSPTGSLYETTTIDDLGTFSLSGQIESRYVEVIASGFYFNEVSGELSSANITLRALADLSISENINVNILTTIGRDRIKYLVENGGLTFEEAKQQAEREVLSIFNINEDDISSFDQMDISQEGTSNAILLAVSAMLQGDNTVAELSELISKIGLDIKEDGALEEGSSYMDEITGNAGNLNLYAVTSNLESRYEAIGLSAAVPAFKIYIDSVLNGESDNEPNDADDPDDDPRDVDDPNNEPTDADYPDTLIDTISTGPPGYPHGVTVTPDGSYVYVTNFDTDSVLVIRTSDNTITESISVGDAPRDIAISTDGNHAYVTNYRDETVSVIRTLDNTVVDTISLTSAPRIVAVTPDGSNVYVSEVGGKISVIRTLDNTVVDFISLDGSPYGIAITPDGSYAYVGSSLPSKISVIRTSDNTVVDTISDSGSKALAITPDGNYVYATISSNRVSVIRTSDNTVIDTISVSESYPESIAITPDGNYVYVGSYTIVSVIQTSDNTILKTISAGVEIIDIAISPDSNYVYVTPAEHHRVSVIGKS